ncbi:MAG: nucleotidyltransferase family protein [Halieaceae bacterium]|jgi:MurNAc alpha-1-phosphate uridylyltransferase|nr:nucleotidyltransferase family protein [Halieaceae bacterium]MBT5134449.1 nucleotidyltransferase family protein [Halieaceae bacterium]MBT5556890.1 nucleotidyltransferase family protein [Halieaceae bacterium]MBT6182037.1 nucleotidyltransferase family protein [Halieaceae bacterium]
MKHAIILAAGEGRRMRPLTDTRPKPLIKIGGKSLLERHIEGLSAAGFTDIVVNASYFASQIVDFCHARKFGDARITVVVEETPLETAGGIVNALPLLGERPFAVVNGDVYTDFPFARLQAIDLQKDLAHLVMVPNPAHHPKGDFVLEQGRLMALGQSRVTYAGLSVMRPELFDGVRPGKAALRPLLDTAITQARLSAQLWSGLWSDVGTPARLRELENKLDQ